MVVKAKKNETILPLKINVQIEALIVKKTWYIFDKKNNFCAKNLRSYVRKIEDKIDNSGIMADTIKGRWTGYEKDK